MSGERYKYLTSSSSKRDEIEPSPKNFFLTLTGYTTAHGLARTRNAKGLVKRLFWSVVMLISISMLISHISLIFLAFFARPVDVSVGIQHENELLFPSITLCNMNPVRRSALENSNISLKLATTPGRRRKRAVSNHACEDGWYYYQSEESCYNMFTTMVTQAVAETECQNQGAHLLTITDADEENFVISLMTDWTTDYWIGLAPSGGTFIWVDGTPFTYTNWNPQHPDAGLSCARIVETAMWKTQICTGGYYYVCERPAINATSVTPTDSTSQTITTTESNLDETSTSAAFTTTTSVNVLSTMQATSAYITDIVSNTVTPTTTPTSTVTPTTTPTSTVTPIPSTYIATESTPPATMPTTTTTTTPPAPQPLPGSRFPERIIPREDFQQEEKLKEVLADVPASERSALGYVASDMILDCQYAGYDCYITDFYNFFNPTHGNCFVFNSGWNDTRGVRTSHKAGHRYGLKVILNIGQDDYVTQGSDTAGVRVVVHPHSRMPFPEDEGITVSPGLATSVGIRKVSITRLGQPYGNCSTSESTDLPNVYAEYYPIKYSMNACEKTCYQSFVIDRCGCADYRIITRGSAFGNINVSVCDSSDIIEDDCKYEVEKEFNENKLPCDCPPVCEDTIFSAEVSNGLWPSDVATNETLINLESKIANLLNDPSDPDKYRRNLIKLLIYYEEFNFEIIKENPAYPPESFFSDFGGVLGLWLGMSAVTAFEFIELFMDLIHLAMVKFFIRKIPSKSKNTKVNEGSQKRVSLDSGHGSARGSVSLSGKTTSTTLFDLDSYEDFTKTDHPVTKIHC